MGLREKLGTALVEAAAARPPFSAFVSCVATACVRVHTLRCVRLIIWTFFIVTSRYVQIDCGLCAIAVVRACQKYVLS